jgi:hypothetical protein
VGEMNLIAAAKGEKYLTNWPNFIALPSIMSGAILLQLHNNFTELMSNFPFQKFLTHQGFV